MATASGCAIWQPSLRFDQSPHSSQQVRCQGAKGCRGARYHAHSSRQFHIQRQLSFLIKLITGRLIFWGFPHSMGPGHPLSRQHIACASNGSSFDINIFAPNLCNHLRHLRSSDLFEFSFFNLGCCSSSLFLAFVFRFHRHGNCYGWRRN
jgi:hypothetical protein